MVTKPATFVTLLRLYFCHEPLSIIVMKSLKYCILTLTWHPLWFRKSILTLQQKCGHFNLPFYLFNYFSNFVFDTGYVSIGFGVVSKKQNIRNKIKRQTQCITDKMWPLYFNLVLSKMFSKNKSEGGCTSSFGGVLFTDRQPDERKSFG